MKKILQMDGIECSIVLTQNGASTTIKGSDPIWHEEYTRQIRVHVCKGYAGLEEVVSELFRDWTPADIEKVVKKVEDELSKFVGTIKYRQENQKKLQEKLRELGF
jgi:hypothetical protein